MLDDLEVGKAAEHLVCYDLIMQGYNAFLSDQGLAYDVLLDHNSKLYRIQVKSTRKPSVVKDGRVRYRFGMRKGRGSRPYGVNDFDMAALVAHDIKTIAYLPSSKTSQCIEFTVDRSTWGKHIADFAFDKLIKDLC